MRVGALLRRRQEALVMGSAATLMAVAIALPMVVLLGDAVPLALEATQARRSLLLGSLASASRLLLESAGLAACVTMTTIALGVPLGIALARFDVPLPRAALLLHCAPMFLPPFLLALGWFHLVGRGGVLGSEAGSWLLFSRVGHVLVLTSGLTPFVTSLVALAATGIAPALEDAARVVAGSRRIAVRILFPLTAPAATLAALVVFTLAFSELGVPMFLRVPAYPAAILARLGGIDFAPEEALALSLPLIAFALALFAVEWSLARRFRAPSLAWRSSRPRLVLGGSRRVAGALVWGWVGLTLLPLLVLLAHGLPALPELDRWLAGSVANSLISACSAATIIAVLAGTAGWAIGRDRPGSRALDALAFLGFAMPSALLGVALINLWNRPTTGTIYGSLAIVVLGYVCRYAAVGVRTVTASVLRTSASTEEAAATVGAGFVRRLRWIIVPEQRRALLGAWLLAFVFSLRDLETPVLFYPPGAEPLMVRIFTLEANAPGAVVAALATTQVVMTALVLVAGGALLRRSEGG
jgi:iron(III) transport system permease protein